MTQPLKPKWEAAIPGDCYRAHLPSSSPLCDTARVLDMAKKKERPRDRNADMNAVAGLDEDWNLHYAGGPEENHFTHRLDPQTKKIVRMPEHLRHKDVIKTPESEIRLWRKNVGTDKSPKWVKAYTCAERNLHAKARGVRICWEIKSIQYRHAKYAKRLVTSVRATKHTAWYFTIIAMRFWAGKLNAIHAAGGQTALSRNGQKRTAARVAKINENRAGIDQLWSHWG